MILKSTRKLSELKEVIKESNQNVDQDIYWVFSEVGDKLWENMTIITPGLLSNEYPKTYGHYHASSDQTEIYKVIKGQGIFLLQKKHTENGKLVENKIDKVFLVAGEEGDEIQVPSNYGHSWSNTGSFPLITVDNWKWGHTDDDYLPIKRQQGMSYYIEQVNGKINLVPNQNYIELPQPIWVTAKEFEQAEK